MKIPWCGNEHETFSEGQCVARYPRWCIDCIDLVQTLGVPNAPYTTFSVSSKGEQSICPNTAMVSFGVHEPEFIQRAAPKPAVCQLQVVPF